MPRTSADFENTKVPARALPTYPQRSYVLAGHGFKYGPSQAPSSSLSTPKRVEIIQHHEKQLRQFAKTYRQFESRQFAKQFLLDLAFRKARDVIPLCLAILFVSILRNASFPKPPFVVRLFFRAAVEISIPTISRSIAIARRFGMLLLRGREGNIYVGIRPVFKRNQLRLKPFEVLLWRFQINQKILRELNVWFPGASDISAVSLP
ncbi:hypothetical protein PoMZ_02567 [Pyricularia oryzae]|uniref:Uncharacterized protein n=1 Tax=Pyricularia oryzae TaxID=318829 RepID=A0A4P7NBK8_PYROR|nr:hypothetical protein PoMZ_02567 [Pyricularia oryzae]